MKTLKLYNLIKALFITILLIGIFTIFYGSISVKSDDNITITDYEVYWNSDNNINTQVTSVSGLSTYYLYLYTDESVAFTESKQVLQENIKQDVYFEEHGDYIYKANTSMISNGLIIWTSFWDCTNSMSLIHSKSIPNGKYYCVMFADVKYTYDACYLIGYVGCLEVQNFGTDSVTRLDCKNTSGQIQIKSVEPAGINKFVGGLMSISGTNTSITTKFGFPSPEINYSVKELSVTNNILLPNFVGCATATTKTVESKTAIDTYDVDYYDRYLKPTKVCYGEDVTLYVKYDRYEYLVAYCKNDGTGTEFCDTFESGSTDPLSKCMFTREGYTFIGWNRYKIDTVAEYSDEASFNSLYYFENDYKILKLYAIWEPNNYTVSLKDSEDGSEVWSFTGPYLGTIDYSTIVFPKKTGYAFKGWNKELPTTMPLNGDTLYATYNKTYTIKFLDDEDGNEIFSFTGVKDATIDYTGLVEPSPTNRIFTGWSQTKPTKIGESDVTIYATYIYGYTLNILDDVGGNVIFTKFAMPGTTIDYSTLVTPSKEGYRFADWSQTKPDKMPSSDTTIYATFNKLYTIKFLDAAGGNEIFSFTGINNETIDYTSLVEPSKTNYVFSGWSQTKPTKVGESDVTIYATFKAIVTLSVYKEIGGELLFTVTDVEGTATDFSTLAEPTKQGYVFEGWDPELPDVLPSTNSAINGTWSKVKKLYFLNELGGALLAEHELKVGQPITGVTAPTNYYKEGYIFNNWSMDIPVTMPDEDVYILAVFEKLYYVKYYDEIDGNLLGSKGFRKGEAVDDITTDEAIKTGYSFDGWDREKPQTMPEDDYLIFAKWKINQYTITFDAGVATVDSITQDYLSAVTAPTDPISPGYIFVKWEPALPETMPAENITCVAVYDALEHTVTVKLNNGSPIYEVKVGHYMAVGTLEEPTKEHYGFDKWDTDLTELITADTTIEALWIINSHSVTFKNCNEGEDVVSYFNYGDAIVTPECKKTNYDFSAWDIDIPETMPDEDLVFTAQWVYHKYKIIYDTDGGSAISTDEITYKQPTRLAPNPTKEGYTFAGWDKTLPTLMPGYDITLKALWTANTYKLKYIVEGNVYYESNVDFGTTLTAITEPVKEGYNFVGWSVTLPETMPAFDLTLSAKFEIIKCTVTFYDAKGLIYNSQTVDYGKKLKQIEPPTKNDYSFVDWYTNINDKNTKFDFNLPITAVSTNVYPLFEELEKFNIIKETIKDCEITVSSPDGLYVDTKLNITLVQNEDIEDPNISSNFIIDYSKYLPMDDSLIGCVYNIKLMRNNEEYKVKNLTVTFEVPENLRTYTLYLYHVISVENWEWVETFDYNDGVITMNVDDLQEFAIFYYRNEPAPEDPVDYVKTILVGVATVAVTTTVAVSIGVAVKRKRQRDAFDW